MTPGSGVDRCTRTPLGCRHDENGGAVGTLAEHKKEKTHHTRSERAGGRGGHVHLSTPERPSRPVTGPDGGLMTAAEELTLALVDLTDRGERTPCQGRHRDRWTSDDADDRAWAAAVCVGLGCEVLEECRAAAAENGEKHYVWGGVDHTATVQHKRRAPCAQA